MMRWAMPLFRRAHERDVMKFISLASFAATLMLTVVLDGRMID